MTVESASLINEKEPPATVGVGGGGGGVKRPSLPAKANRKSSSSSSNRNGVKAAGAANTTEKNLHASAAGAVAVGAANDGTTRGGGGHSTSYNPHMIDSLSTLSDKNNKIVVRIVTVFSVIFFLICFAMIAFTLRMSEKIDAQLRNEFSASAAEAALGSDSAAQPTRQFHPGMLASQSTTRMKRANISITDNSIAPRLL